MTLRPFFPEHWMTSQEAEVFHVTHPDRNAWCGQRWTSTSFIGVVGLTTRRCRRCQSLGEGA